MTELHDVVLWVPKLSCCLIDAQCKNPGQMTWHSMFSLKCLASNELCLQVIPEQVKAGEGTIIVTGASASRRGSAKFAQLAGSKFALRSLAQSAAREFHPKVHIPSY